MVNWIIAILARTAGTWRSAAIMSLQAQLAAAKAERARYENNYLILADDHADLRAAYERLAFERLQAWGLDREGKPPAPRRLRAPKAGENR